jgi:hypothetical protein
MNTDLHHLLKLYHDLSTSIHLTFLERPYLYGILILSPDFVLIKIESLLVFIVYVSFLILKLLKRIIKHYQFSF